MNYLTKLIFFLIILLPRIIIASENEIIFKINEKIYSSIDFKNRIKFLEVLNDNKFEITLEEKLIDDYFSSALFYEYVRNNNN